MNVAEQFFIMRKATLCLSEEHRARAFNGLCHTLHEQWSIPVELLAPYMDRYGYEYTIECLVCGTDVPWNEKCSECNNTGWVGVQSTKKV